MLHFHSIRYKNFLSTGNTFTNIILDNHPSTIIVGKNGSGKSTFIDAICFALYGRPYRNINKPLLLNSINDRELVVECEFMTNGKGYKVIRGIKPALFEVWCDGKLLPPGTSVKDNQDILENNILKLNYKAFTQIVILGSKSYVPFMLLPAADRRLIIEELLDIRIFSAMNVILKQKLQDFKSFMTEMKHEEDILNVKIESVEKHLKEIEERRSESEERYTLAIQKKLDEMKFLNNELFNMQNAITKKKLLVVEHEALIQKKGAAQKLKQKLCTNITEWQKEMKFYQEQAHCPTCTQPITEDVRQERVSVFSGMIGTNDKMLDDLENVVIKLEHKVKEMDNIQQDIASFMIMVNNCNMGVLSLQRTIEELEKQRSDVTQASTNVLEYQSQLKEHIEQRENLAKRKQDIIATRHYHELAGVLLKDTGIKTKIIKQYLPVINTTINQYLSAMHFFVNFTLNESFEETIRSRHRDKFSYENFSDGERMRLDLALLFTWRTLGKLKNSASTNLLIMDETLDSSLDDEGAESCINIIQNLAESQENLFVISHRSDIVIDKFRHSIKFDKNGDFSRIIEQ